MTAEATTTTTHSSEDHSVERLLHSLGATDAERLSVLLNDAERFNACVSGTSERMCTEVKEALFRYAMLEENFSTIAQPPYEQLKKLLKNFPEKTDILARKLLSKPKYLDFNQSNEFSFVFNFPTYKKLYIALLAINKTAYYLDSPQAFGIDSFKRFLVNVLQNLSNDFKNGMINYTHMLIIINYIKNLDERFFQEFKIFFSSVTSIIENPTLRELAFMQMPSNRFGFFAPGTSVPANMHNLSTLPIELQDEYKSFWGKVGSIERVREVNPDLDYDSTEEDDTTATADRTGGPAR